MTETEKKHDSAFKSFLAGGAAGTCVVVTGQPFDMLKVRLQTMPKPAPGQPPMYTGMVDCARKIMKAEGFFGLYRGMGAPLAGVAPMFAISFFGYNLGKKLCIADLQQPKYYEYFSAGMISAIFTTTIMVPGERIKCLLQVQGAPGATKLYNGPVDCAVKLFKEGGIRSIYRGTGATLLRDMPASGMYFMTYDTLRDKLKPADADLSPMATLFAGGCGGVANWLVAIPPDTLKSRLQSAPEGRYPKGIRSVYAELMANEGVLALYRGTAPIMLRAFIANAAGFFGFEVAMQALHISMPHM